MRALSIVFVAFFSLFAVGRVQASEFHALLIGNNAYEGQPLKNPVNDVRLIGSALKDLGFKVTIETDLDQRSMEEAIRIFSNRLPKNSLAMLYFSGHGVQVDQENYLVPIDADLPDEIAAKRRTVPLNYAYDYLTRSSASMKVLVLDCCRDNPFTRSWTRQRSWSKGLTAQQQLPEGTMLQFATAPGQTALDGSGNASPYAEAFAASLQERPSTGLVLQDVFSNTARRVKEATGQKPWQGEIDLCIERIYLTPEKQTEPAASATTLVETPTPLNSQPCPASRLIRQGRVYSDANRFSMAIEQFTTAIQIAKDEDTKIEAFTCRGLAYRQRNHEGDIERALSDFIASNKKGIHLTSKRNSDLVRDEERHQVRPGDVIFVTEFKIHKDNEWMWVRSVNDDTRKCGWVKPSILQPAHAAPVSVPTPAVTKPIIEKPVIENEAGHSSYTDSNLFVEDKANTNGSELITASTTPAAISKPATIITEAQSQILPNRLDPSWPRISQPNLVAPYQNTPPAQTYPQQVLQQPNPTVPQAQQSFYPNNNPHTPIYPGVQERRAQPHVAPTPAPQQRTYNPVYNRNSMQQQKKRGCHNCLLSKLRNR